MDCLTLFAMSADYYASLPFAEINIELPGRETHLLRLETLDLHLPKTVKYVVQPNAAYPAYTTIAYTDDSCYKVATPFVLIQGGVGADDDLAPKLVVMRHVDEALSDIASVGMFLQIP